MPMLRHYCHTLLDYAIDAALIRYAAMTPLLLLLMPLRFMLMPPCCRHIATATLPCHLLPLR